MLIFDAVGFQIRPSGLLNGLTYNDGVFNWEVDLSGRITGFAPIMGMPPIVGRAGNVEKMGVSIGKTSANRIVQKEQIENLAKRYRLSKKQRRILHDEVSHQGYDYHEIEELIKELFNK